MNVPINDEDMADIERRLTAQTIEPPAKYRLDPDTLWAPIMHSRHLYLIRTYPQGDEPTFSEVYEFAGEIIGYYRWALATYSDMANRVLTADGELANLLIESDGVLSDATADALATACGLDATVYRIQSILTY